MTKHRSRILFGLTLLATTACANPFEVTVRYRVSGHVTAFQSSAPVAGLSLGVRRDGVSTDQYLANAVSDADGNYTMEFSASKCERWFVVSARTTPREMPCDARPVVMNLTTLPSFASR